MKSCLSPIRSHQPVSAALCTASPQPSPCDVLPRAGSAECALTTAEFAAELSLQQQSIRKRLSQTGSYFGIRPFKLPNGKLRWPAGAVGELLGWGQR